MNDLVRLRTKLHKKISSAEIVDEISNAINRQQYIENAYSLGGKAFLERVKTYGKTEQGLGLNLRNWYCEFLMLVGDLRISHTLTLGASQCGKTLAHALLMIDLLAVGKLNAGWFYQSKTALDQNVPIFFHPVAKYYLNSLVDNGFKFQNLKERHLNTRYQVDGATGVFSYVSTTRTHQEDVGIAAAGSSVVSYHIDLAFLEERSQYLPGSADAIPRRLDASHLPNKPRRELGTPGGGLGIEKDVEDVDFYFYPHYHCPHCGKIFPLSPKGCLLKKFLRTDLTGKPVEDYLSEAGRPVNWFFKDQNDPVKSAFLACSDCGGELDDETRFNARFYCLKTGISASDFLDSLDQRDYNHYLKIAIHLSPLTRERDGNYLAFEIIKSSSDYKITNDWQQQVLGFPSSNSTLNVSLDLLRRSIASEPPIDREVTFRVCGIDPGRSEDWLTIMDFYICDDYGNLSIAEILSKSVRHVLFAKDVLRPQIPELLEQYKVEYGLIDNEPSRESSINLARETCLDLVNQVSGLTQIVKQVIVADGGIEFPCWNVRNEKFMQSVFDGFVCPAFDDLPLYRLPSDWNKWLGNPSERSPLVHLSAPYKGSDGKWHRGKNNVDDLYMTFLFCEVAFYLLLNNLLQSSLEMEVGSFSYHR